jgi:hypothetical protein
MHRPAFTRLVFVDRHGNRWDLVEPDHGTDYLLVRAEPRDAAMLGGPRRSRWWMRLANAVRT